MHAWNIELPHGSGTADTTEQQKNKTINVKHPPKKAIVWRMHNVERQHFGEPQVGFTRSVQ